MLYLVFDCESIGLHGETFAVGAVVIDHHGTERTTFHAGCASRKARGSDPGRAWVEANVDPHACIADYSGPQALRRAFWEFWLRWKAEGALLCADVAWPVEARFLAACVDDAPEAREWEGPYPLLSIDSVRFAAGYDPLETGPRLKDEEPPHNPLCDARQSARLLLEALQEIGEALEPEPSEPALLPSW